MLPSKKSSGGLKEIGILLLDFGKYDIKSGLWNNILARKLNKFILIFEIIYN